MTTPTRPQTDDRDGRVFGTWGRQQRESGDAILDVDRQPYPGGNLTVITLGRVDFEPGTDEGVAHVTGAIRLKPDEVDQLIARLTDRSAGQAKRVEADLWSHLLHGRRKVYADGGEPPAAEQAWFQHYDAMHRQLPGDPDDLQAMRLKWIDHDEIALSAHLADRNARCAEAVRRVLSVAGPLTQEEIYRHPEWRNEYSVAASLGAILRAGVKAGWLQRRVDDSTSRWALVDEATS